MTNCFHGGNELHDIPLHVIHLNQDDPKNVPAVNPLDTVIVSYTMISKNRLKEEYC